jgi:hypothetical protein
MDPETRPTENLYQETMTVRMNARYHHLCEKS